MASSLVISARSGRPRDPATPGREPSVRGQWDLRE